ncbi:MAG: helix-turn-helix domain-containing protein [Streptosporangiaceae bacterium]|jgi:WD40 repeat protein/energy-coupling factor transporter ATP-binding protein EcfA2
MLDDPGADDGVANPDRISTRRDFARELSLIKECASLTVRDVARALGIPASTVGGYFAGRYLPVQPPGMLRKVLLACGVTDEADIARWLAALGRVRRAPGPRPADAPAPYRGLESFQPEDAGWFFGRHELTELLVEQLRLHSEQGGLLMVVGPSGSGKSSLLRAGLIPALEGGALGSGTWPPVLLAPGTHPVHELAMHLASVTDDDSGGRLIIVVDQFEEVFTACQDEAERVAFIKALCAATALVVVGLRADFYDRALRYPALVRALDRHQVLVGPMNTEQVRSAITGPAVKAGLEIEDGLVEILLRDLGPAADGAGSSPAHVPSALPLLSYALLATWEHSHGGKLTVADYLDTGGINGAVASSADKVYNELTRQQQDLARQIFIRLVHIADDTADTRRRVPRSELAFPLGEPQAVLDSFIDKRLITAGTGDVELAHDALLLAWPLLRGWIDSARAGVPVHRQLTAAAEAWQESDRDPGMLYSGGRLAAAEDWAGQPGHASDLNIPERDFLDASVQRKHAEERTARRRTLRLQLIIAALAVLSLVAGVLAVAAFQQKNAATYQRDLAISRQVATDANQLRSTDIALAMQLSLAAYRVSPTAEALSSLLDSTATQPATRLAGPGRAGLQSVAFSPGDGMLAAGGDDGTVRLWDVRRLGHPVRVGGALAGPGIATSLAFSPDGKTLAVGSSSGTVRIWSISVPDRPVLLDRLATGPVNSVAYSPDGQMLAAGSSDGRVFVWSADHLSSVSAGVGQATAVAFSPDGRLLAVSGSTGRIGMWDVAGSGLRAGVFVNGPANGVNAVTFSPDSRMLAAGSDNSEVWLWKLDAGRPARLASLTGPRSWIYSVAFSPDGTTIAAGSADNNAYVWDVAHGTLVATLPHPAPVLSVAFGHGSGELASADADGVARIWTLPGPVLTGPPGSVFNVAFSPGGSDLVSASALPSGQGALQLWSVTDLEQPVPLGTPLTSGTPDGTVAYGPGGRLAAGNGSGGIILWNVRDARHPVPLPSPPTALKSAIQYVAFNKSGHLMAAGSSAGQIGLWDTTDIGRAKPLAVIRSETADSAYRDVYAIAFSPDDRLLASASADGTVRLWDITDPGRPEELGPPLVRLGSAVYQVAFSPDGDILAASGADGEVRLWDVSDRHLLTVLTGPPQIVYDLAFSPDGRTLATANGDKTVTLWDIMNPASPVSLGSLTGPTAAVFSVAFSPTGDAIAAGSQDGNTLLWLATPAAAARYVCSISGAAITRAEWEQYLPELPYNPPCKT